MEVGHPDGEGLRFKVGLQWELGSPFLARRFHFGGTEVERSLFLVRKVKAARAVMELALVSHRSEKKKKREEHGSEI